MTQNVEYARTLLLRLDHASTSIKTGTRKSSTQDTLAAKRDLIKRLNQRLIELNQLDEPSDADDSTSDSENEHESDSDSEDGEGGDLGPGRPHEFAPAQRTSNQIDWTPLSQIPGLKGIPTSENDIEASQTLRERGAVKGRDKAPAPASAQSLSATDNRSQASTATTTALFGDRDSQKQNLSTTQVLEETEKEHSLLTSSLVSLAQTLKSSSLSFQQSLVDEKEVFKRAEQGLERNEMGMESAGRRMGTLRRMTEGQGWWGRMKLYAIIAALWLACFLIVFVGPKLRF